MADEKIKQLNFEPECRNAENHAKSPAGYSQWVEWVEEKSKTHKQIRCSGCGLFKIWIPINPN